jgi:hypothetical protein
MNQAHPFWRSLLLNNEGCYVSFEPWTRLGNCSKVTTLVIEGGTVGSRVVTT